MIILNQLMKFKMSLKSKILMKKRVTRKIYRFLARNWKKRRRSCGLEINLKTFLYLKVAKEWVDQSLQKTQLFPEFKQILNLVMHTQICRHIRVIQAISISQDRSEITISISHQIQLCDTDLAQLRMGMIKMMIRIVILAVRD